MNKDYLGRLDKLSEDGYLRRVVSPCGRMVLYNYTDQCTYEKKWDKYTLNARGTVYEIETGKIIAKAFPKFFNFEELPVSKSRNLLKQKDFSVTEKMDGSLGIIFHYDGEWFANTRGSFTSDQAIECKKIMQRYNFAENRGLESVTLLVEIIYPENKIILDYGIERKLVLLAAYNNISLEECGRETLIEIGEITNIDVVKRDHFDSIEELINKQKTLTKNEEGFVVLFNRTGERVKFKSKEYLKLAHALSSMTPLNFWKLMKNGKISRDALQVFPEEFRKETDCIANNLEKLYDDVRNDISLELNSIIINAKNTDNPRKFLGINGQSLKHYGVLFSVFDNNYEQIDKYIMKQIRPHGNEIGDLS